VVLIVVDPDELSALGLFHERSLDELSGIVADIRRRLLAIDLAKLTSYGIDPASWLDEIGRVCSRLMDDALQLEQATNDLRRQLWQATQDQPGALGPYGAALPDLWWFGGGSSAGSSGSSGAPPGTPADGATTGAGASADVRQQIVGTAEQWVGIPYLWGGGHGAVVAPRAVNVDCSGLVHEVFGENGINIGGTAATMFASGTRVPDLAHALPGDLLFWGTGSNIHHVAIYIGNGQMIEAPHTGAWVHVTNVYGGDFAGIRRVLP
jgi:cell wall-associated NlpC family hydrolase